MAMEAGTGSDDVATLSVEGSEIEMVSCLCDDGVVTNEVACKVVVLQNSPYTMVMEGSKLLNQEPLLSKFPH